MFNQFINTGLDDRILKSLPVDNVSEELIKAMNKQGLVQKEVQVKGKNGQVFTRKQWVKASEDSSGNSQRKTGMIDPRNMPENIRNKATWNGKPLSDPEVFKQACKEYDEMNSKQKQKSDKSGTIKVGSMSDPKGYVTMTKEQLKEHVKGQRPISVTEFDSTGKQDSLDSNKTSSKAEEPKTVRVASMSDPKGYVTMTKDNTPAWVTKKGRFYI